MAKELKYVISKGTKRLISVLCLFALIGIFAADRFLVVPARKAIHKKVDPGDDWQKYHGKQFTVVNVVDGDTYDLDVPDGKYKTTRIRLMGIDTPETKNDHTGVMHYGPEASDFAKKLLLNQRVIIRLSSAGNVRGKYGRLLGYVVIDDGLVVNEMLVSRGYAYADLRFEHDHFISYVELMDAALRDSRGLWERVSFDKLPGWLQRERPGLRDVLDK